MRRYWIISLIIGGVAVLLTLAAVYLGGFEIAVTKLGEFYQSRGWTDAIDLTRLRWLEILFIGLSAPALALAVVEAIDLSEKVLITLLGLFVIALISPVLALYGILWDPFSSLSGGILAATGALLFSRTKTGRRKRFLTKCLGQRISATVFHQLLEGREALFQEGEKRDVTTLVCRILPSSPHLGANSPDDILRIGGLFHRTVTSFLLTRGAFIDEAGPERVVATFGVFNHDTEPVSRACRAALDLRRRLQSLSQECESRWYLPLSCGIGLNSGERTFGLCRSERHTFFSGTGGDTELAERLALANARLHSELLLGPETYARLNGQFEVRPLEMTYDPHRQSLLEIYQLLASKETFTDEDRARRDHFWRGIILLREGASEAALEALSQARQPGVEDAALTRLINLAQESVVTPLSRPSRLIREFTEDGGHARLIQNL